MLVHNKYIKREKGQWSYSSPYLTAFIAVIILLYYFHTHFPPKKLKLKLGDLNFITHFLGCFLADPPTLSFMHLSLSQQQNKQTVTFSICKNSVAIFFSSSLIFSLKYNFNHYLHSSFYYPISILFKWFIWIKEQ